MSNSRDIADSAATINYIDTVTSNVQTQIDNVDSLPTQSGNTGKFLTTNGSAASWATLVTDPTLGTLTQTFTNGQETTISLTSTVLAPVVTVTKEVPQTGVTNNNWDVSSTAENYTRLDSAAATTLDWGDSYSTGTYASKSLTLQSTDSRAIAIKPDGTIFYSQSRNSDAIYQYGLSTAYDLSSGSYSNKSVSFSSFGNNTHGMAISGNGLHVYCGIVNDGTIRQLDLSTAWDLSTSSNPNKSFSITSQGSYPLAFCFNNDGTKMYAVLNDVDVYQYNLSTAYDVSSASYNSVKFSQSDTCNGMAISPDGKAIVLSNDTTNALSVLTLSTAYDLSTASLSSGFSVAGQTTEPFGVAIANSKLYLNSTATAFQYSLGTALSLGSGSFASADVGKTIEANAGVFVLTATTGTYAESTTPTSYAQVASGSWSMYGVVYNTTDGDLELSNYIGAGFDISASAYTGVSVQTAQDNGSQGVAFNTDGSKMYFIGKNTDSIFQYSLPTAFSLSGATYDSVSFSVASQDGVPHDLAFNPAGTKLFVLGEQTGWVYQYSLSTAFNIGTASYDSVAFNFGAQESAPHGLTFNPAGTKMFICGTSGQDVNEYTLSSAFNVGTASFVDAFSVSAQDTFPSALAFNTDGTVMLVLGQTGDAVYSYSLTSGFDVSTASYSNSFSVSSQATAPTGIAFSATGSSFIICCSATDYIYEYTSQSVTFVTGYQPVHTTSSIDSTYWTDINSMTANQAAGDGNVYYAISTDDRTTWGIVDNTSGERDIVRNNGGTWQYNSNGTYASETWTNGTTNTELATLAQAMEGAVAGYNLANASYDSVNYSTGSLQQRGVFFSADGTKMFLANASTSDVILRYSLSTAWDITTASADAGQSFSYGSQDADATAFTLNADGTRLYVLGHTSKTVYQYIMTTAYDLTTASYNSVSLSVNSQDTSPFGITFNNDGTKMYVGGQTNDKIFAYTLTTGFDLSTASYSSVSLSVSAQDSAIKGMLFNNAGTKLFMFGTTTASGYQYSLSSAFDLSTASYDSSSFSFASQDATPSGYAFKADGTELFMVGDITDKVYKYLTTSYTNQMDKTQLDAVTDPNHIVLGNDLDLSIILNMTSGTTVPSSNGVAINYDATVLNKGAILGTDYDFDAPATNKVRITALAANNLKVRVL